MGRRLTAREVVFVAVGAALAGALIVVLQCTIEAGRPAVGNPSEAQREFEDVDAPVAEYVGRLRAAGEPTTLREVVERDAPRGGNAAERIRTAALLLDAEVDLRSISGDPVTFWPFGGMADTPESETPENLAKLKELLPRLESTCAVVSKALDAPRCRFPFEECDAPENLAKLVPGADRTVAALKAFAEGQGEAAAELLSGPVDPVFSVFRNN